MKGKLRIISGNWRGRRLSVPDLPGLRPSGDRAREVLFNWLQGYVRGSRCLDLFAGTGALGLEAASRGAGSVVLVEQDRGLCRHLTGLGEQWPGGDVLTVAQADAMRWLERAEGPFDIAFVDPPFGAGHYAATLDALLRPGLLAPGALVYVESASRSPAPLQPSQNPSTTPASSPCEAEEVASSPENWSILREKRLGDVRMQLLQAPD
jgi:16S rRNA (guanine966-N2)-methyltransferase